MNIYLNSPEELEMAVLRRAYIHGQTWFDYSPDGKPFLLRYELPGLFKIKKIAFTDGQLASLEFCRTLELTKNPMGCCSWPRAPWGTTGTSRCRYSFSRNVKELEKSVKKHSIGVIGQLSYAIEPEKDFCRT
jgi:hypothetical protein